MEASLLRLVHAPTTELFDDPIMRDGLADEPGLRHSAAILGLSVGQVNEQSVGATKFKGGTDQVCQRESGQQQYFVVQALARQISRARLDLRPRRLYAASGWSKFLTKNNRKIQQGIQKLE